jgi:Flp pilus assembly protein CpaB
MKDKQLILVAVLLGVAAVVLIQHRFSELEAAARYPTTTLYRAVGDIAAGEMTVGDARLRGRLEQVAGVPAAFAEAYPTALRGDSLASDAERRIERAIPSGQFIETGHLLPPDQPPSARKQIPPGRELVALPVTNLSSAAYLVRPGDLVDIYQIRAGSGPAGAAAESTAAKHAVRIAADVEIFSVDATVKGGDEAGASRGQRYAVVTIAARPEEVSAFLVAREEGPLTLTLKSGARE